MIILYNLRFFIVEMNSKIIIIFIDFIQFYKHGTDNKLTITLIDDV